MRQLAYPKDRGSPELPEIPISTFCPQRLKGEAQERIQSTDLLLYWALPGQGGGTTLPLCKAASPPDPALGSACWGVPSSEKSFHKLTPPGERSGATFSSRFGYLPPHALGVRCNPDAQQPPNSLFTWESSFKKLSFKKLMCSQAVKLTKQKGHFPEQQEQFGAVPGSWKAGYAEHRLCRALSRATALWARVFTQT